MDVSVSAGYMDAHWRVPLDELLGCLRVWRYPLLRVCGSSLRRYDEGSSRRLEPVGDLLDRCDHPCDLLDDRMVIVSADALRG